MRILRLDLDTGEEIDLHPYVTMLGGLGPSMQRRVADQLVRIARGDVEGLSGLVEAHGLLIELDPSRVGSLALPADADVLVRADQLPGARLAATTTDPDVDRALAEKVAAIEGEIARIGGELGRVTAELDRSTAELDEARRGLDEFAITAHEAAQRAVVEAEELARRRAEGIAGTNPPPRDPEAERRDRLATELTQLRDRQAHLQTLLDEERLGLLQLLEQLEVERATLDALRDERAGTPSEPAGEPAVEPEPEPAPEPEPELPDPDDMKAVHAAIRQVVAGAPDPPMVPSLPAAALADQVAAHRERHREWERELAERGLDTNVLRERLEAARRVEAAAAEDARPKTVPPEDEREIERLHDIVTENADKRDSRRHGKEATRLYEEASVQLDALLESYGFPTYAAFIMGRTAPSIDPDARRRHEDAKVMVANVEREIEAVSAAVADDPHGRMLRAERDQLWAAAEELLGDGYEGDVEDALRRATVPGPVEFDAPDRLRGLLARLGVDLSDATTTGRLLEVADAWYTAATEAHEAARLGSAEPSDGARSSDSNGGIHLPGDPVPPEPAVPAAPLDPVEVQEALVADLFDRSVGLDAELSRHEADYDRQAEQIAGLEAELVAIDEARGTGRERSDDASDPLADAVAADPNVIGAREQAALTEARLERHRAAVERVDRLHAAIGDARATERMLTAQRDGLRTELGGLRGDPHGDDGTPLPPIEWSLTEEGIGPIEWYLLGRVASLRSVSSAGSVPLVLDDAFRNLAAEEISALCDALARIGETVQVIYLGDEPAVADWAERQGLDLAAVVRPGQPAI
jgi:hypothetical protein